MAEAYCVRRRLKLSTVLQGDDNFMIIAIDLRRPGFPPQTDPFPRLGPGQ